MQFALSDTPASIRDVRLHELLADIPRLLFTLIFITVVTAILRDYLGASIQALSEMFHEKSYFDASRAPARLIQENNVNSTI